MLNLQEISDRMEIRDLLVSYAYKIDGHDFDGLRDICTPVAQFDYTQTGAIAGGLEDMIAYLKQAIPTFKRLMHMMGDSQLQIDGDHAQAITQCFNPLVLDLGNDEEHTAFVGLWYQDQLARTASGWQFTNRHQQLCYLHNFPENVAAES